MDKMTTKIADLPDNITIQSIDGGSANPYQPSMGYQLNVLHNTSPPPIVPSQMQLQLQKQQDNQRLQEQQQQQLQQQRLQEQEQMRIQQQEAMLLEQQNMQRHYEEEQQKMQRHYEDQFIKQNEQLTQMQQEMANLQQQRLPSRDIPMNTSDYMHDEEIKQNYIPKSNIKGDFVREKEMLNDKKINDHEEKKKNMSTLDAIVNEFQTPVFIVLLFFIFQMPVVNTTIFKKFAFLSITNEDGNFNTTGLVCKSIIFGALFYILCKIVKYIIDI